MLERGAVQLDRVRVWRMHVVIFVVRFPRLRATFVRRELVTKVVREVIQIIEDRVRDIEDGDVWEGIFLDTVLSIFVVLENVRAFEPAGVAFAAVELSTRSGEERSDELELIIEKGWGR